MHLLIFIWFLKIEIYQLVIPGTRAHWIVWWIWKWCELKLFWQHVVTQHLTNTLHVGFVVGFPAFIQQINISSSLWVIQWRIVFELSSLHWLCPQTSRECSSDRLSCGGSLRHMVSSYLSLLCLHSETAFGEHSVSMHFLNVCVGFLKCVISYQSVWDRHTLLIPLGEIHFFHSAVIFFFFLHTQTHTHTYRTQVWCLAQVHLATFSI